MADDDKPSQDAPGKEEFKVFVGGVSYKMDERSMKELFEKYNPEAAVIQVDKMTNRPRGFGFVYFKDRESMLDAIREFHNKEIDGRTISVKEAIPQDQIKPGTPAAALGGGGRRGDSRYPSRDSRYDSRYDRAPDYRGGYDRGAYDRGAGYGADPRYPASYYDSRTADRGYYGEYQRDPYYRDPYARDPYAAPPYAGGADYRYDSRYPAPSAGYDSRYPADYSRGYESRPDDRYAGAGGPDRGRYAAPAARPGPYDRPDTRRDTSRQR